MGDLKQSHQQKAVLLQSSQTTVHDTNKESLRQKAMRIIAQIVSARRRILVMASVVWVNSLYKLDTDKLTTQLNQHINIP